jgi:microcin C transport system ATP-binding protein
MKHSSPLLDVKDLSIDFRHRRSTIHHSEPLHTTGSELVRRITFRINPGETVALVGESGSGKSITALSILRLLEGGCYPSGEICFNGENLLLASEERLQKIRGQEASVIFQEPMTSLNPLHTIEHQISEIILVHHKISRKEARGRTLSLLERVGIYHVHDRLDDYPHQFSGGQRQRIMIAMAVANNPSLLIADEPTASLDVTVQAQIIDLLIELKTALNMAILFISHDLPVVRSIADSVCVMCAGEIVEQGSVVQIFESPRHPYTQKLLNAEPKSQRRVIPKEAPIILEAGPLKVWYPIKRGLFRRTVAYTKALDDVSLKIQEGETVGVVGESGSGKTTLGLALTRLIPSEGPIVFLGHHLEKLSRSQMRPVRKNYQIVFQDPYGSLSPRLLVGSIVEEGLRVQEKNLTLKERETAVACALEQVGLDPSVACRFPHEFSGGQRQRIAIARAMILNPRLIILDEVTSALDRSVQCQIVDLFCDLQSQHNLTYLFITHDLRLVHRLANRILIMQNGCVVESGTPDEILFQPKNEYTKKLFSAFNCKESTHHDRKILAFKA